MKIKVVEVFQDKFNGVMYEKGDILDFETERSNDLIKRGLAVSVEKREAAEKPVEKPKKSKVSQKR